MTYGIICVAFSFGLVFILQESKAESNQNYEEHQKTNSSIYLHNINNLMFGLFFLILDSGRDIPIPDKTGQDKFATFLFTMYNISAIIILLNLTITLMNATIQRFQERRQLYWKFMKTSVCSDFFDSHFMTY